MQSGGRGKLAEERIGKSTSNRYRAFLTVTAFLGWTMVVYEWNVFGLLVGPASKILKVDASQVSFMLAAIQFVMVPIIFLIGYYIDKVGRKVMYQVTLVFTSILTAITGLATYAGIAVLVLVRSGAQGSAQNEQSVAATMITEEMPSRWRSITYSFVQSGWPFGVALAGLVVTFLYGPLGYKYIWLVAVAPMLIIIFARRWTRETIRFTEVEKARRGESDDEAENFTDVKKVKENPFKQVFDPDIRKDTVRAMLLNAFYLGAQVPIVVLAAYYMEEVVNIPVSVAASVITIGSFITIPGYWINGAISEYLGRKTAGILGTVLAFSGTVLFALMGKDYVTLLIGYSFASFWINGNYANVINYINETVPTRVRGSVNVLSTGFGQLAWGIVELIYGFLTPLVGVSGDMVIMSAIFYAVSAALLFTGRNVKVGTPLEDISI